MITADLLRNVPLFAGISESERETIAAHAADVLLRPGDWLIHEGESPSFFVVLAGHLELRKFVDGVERMLITYDPGAYFGEVPLLLESPAIASVRALDDARLARLDPWDFRHLVLSSRALSEEIVRTMAARVSSLSDVTRAAPATAVTIVGHRLDLACFDIRDFLARNRVLYDWIDPGDPAARLPAGVEIDREPGPLVVLADGTRMIAPSLRELAEAVGLRTTATPGTVYDVAVVGAGPAGLAAAVYGASEGLRTIAIEREAPGGQAGTSSRIENYLGFANGISGDELGRRAWSQATRFGAEILVARSVVAIEPGEGDGCEHVIVLDHDERFAARTIVLANGVAWRTLDLVGIEKFLGRGIFYGAGRTEALETRGKDVYLIGGGNSAGQAAMFFANYARSVTLLVRGASLAASMSQYLIDQLATKANVTVATRTRVAELAGSDQLDAIVVEDVATGARRTLATDAVFILIGADAETGALPAALLRDASGYVCTGRDMLDLGSRACWPLERDPYLLETNIPGIFAAGDVRHGSIKRVASGVGEGSMAIAFVHRYLEAAREAAAHR